MGSDKSTIKDPKLVGDTTEATIYLNDIEVRALIDTGSCVSLISKSLYEDKFSDIKLEPLKDFIDIECADGQKLPYEGYIELEINIAERIQDSNKHSCLFF